MLNVAKLKFVKNKVFFDRFGPGWVFGQEIDEFIKDKCKIIPKIGRNMFIVSISGGIMDNLISKAIDTRKMDFEIGFVFFYIVCCISGFARRKEPLPEFHCPIG